MSRRTLYAAIFFSAACFPPNAFAQFTNVINVPPMAAPHSIGLNTQLNVFNGGFVDVDFEAGSGSQVNVFGGRINSQFNARSGSQIRFEGGIVEGAYFGADAGSSVTIAGAEFYLNGTPISQLDVPGAERQLNLPELYVLSGTLLNGTPFVFSSLNGETFADGTLTLEATSLPAIGPALITTSVDPLPLAIRGGQTLVVDSEVTVDAGYFSFPELPAGRGSTIEILPNGKLNAGLSAVGAHVSVAGGYVGEGFQALDGAQVFVSDGMVDNFFRVQSSTVTVSGGSLAQTYLYDGSTLNVSGGHVRYLVPIETTSIAQSGGVIEYLDNLSSGSSLSVTGGAIGGLHADPGSSIVISGDDFRLDGQPIAELSVLGTSTPFDVPLGATLSGNLQDGTPFAITPREFGESLPDGTLTLNVVDVPTPEPTTFVASAGPIPLGIRTGQTLIADSGGTVPAFFVAGHGSEVEIKPGAIVGELFEAVGSRVQIDGGQIGSGFQAKSGSIVNISGGEFDSDVEAFPTAQVKMSGGNLPNAIAGSEGSFEIVGGTIITAAAHGGSQVTIRGGVVQSLFAQADSEIHFYGAEFRNGGEAIAGLDTVGNFVALDAPPAEFYGVLSDGTPFIYAANAANSINSEARLILHRTELPLITQSVITASIDPVPMGIRAGQTLIADPGSVVGDHFRAGVGTTLRVEGGEIGDDLRAISATVRMVDGIIDGQSAFYAGSLLEIDGGMIDSATIDRSTISLRGGHVMLLRLIGSVANISGGHLETVGVTSMNSSINLFGTEFFVNGAPVEGLTRGVPHVISNAFGPLNGRFADGNPFSMFIRGSSKLTLTLVPEPSSAILAIGTLLLAATYGTHSRQLPRC